MAGFFMLGVMGCAEVGTPPPEAATWNPPAPQPRQQVVRPAPPVCVASRDFRQVGIASWYGRPYHGRRTASGQVYNMHGFTAAHRSLPFGSRIRVTNLRNGRAVMLTVNDRGPFVRGRVVDVSYRAARELNFLRDGLTPVRVERVRRC